MEEAPTPYVAEQLRILVNRTQEIPWFGPPPPIPDDKRKEMEKRILRSHPFGVLCPCLSDEVEDAMARWSRNENNDAVRRHAGIANVFACVARFSDWSLLDAAGLQVLLEVLRAFQYKGAINEFVVDRRSVYVPRFICLYYGLDDAQAHVVLHLTHKHPSSPTDHGGSQRGAWLNDSGRAFLTLHDRDQTIKRRVVAFCKANDCRCL